MLENKDGIQSDIIIIGSGAAGIMAALTAARAGLRCCILEKGSHAAVSNGARSGGPSLADTDLQRKEDALVTVEQLYQHMYRFSRGTVNAGLLYRAISKGRTVEKLLVENGIGMKLLPDTYGVGFRARHLFLEAGSKRWQPLVDSLISNDGQIHYNRTAIRLLIENGKLIGVAAEDGKEEGKLYNYYGKAVIIASGGYLGNRQMIRQHFGNINIVPLGSCLSDGAGIKMALEAGGIEDRNWGICANEFGGANSRLIEGKKRFSTNLVYAICAGLLVDRTGRRFMNEQYMSDEPLSVGGEITVRAGKFYAVLDDRMYRELHKQTVYEFYGKPRDWHVGKTVHNTPLRFRDEDLEEDIRNGWAGRGNTLAEAAAVFSLDALEETVKSYNDMCERKKDSQFGKADYLLKPLRQAPYYIFEYEPSAWCTFGGVKTDEYCRILDFEQNIIEGVYVAGVDNGSCYMVPYYDNEGAALGLAFTTGVVAGEQAAAFIAGSKIE